MPSGVGNVTSAAYCMPMGRAPTMKNPSAAAHAYSSTVVETNATPIRLGMASVSVSTR